MYRALCGLLLMASLCACGQTGDLYLADGRPASTAPASATPGAAPAEPQKEKAKETP